MFIKDNQAILEKVEEFCAVLLEQEDYKALRTAISEFEGDKNAIEHYKKFTVLEQLKAEKELTREESLDFNQEERAIYSNPIIRRHLFAQKEFQNLKLTMNDYFDKTIRLGRLPNKKS